MKKRIVSILMALMFSLVLIACKKTGNGDEPPVVDKIAPLLEVVPEVVNLEYNQDYDLMTGVTARDNVDGTITDRVVIENDGGFNKKVEGTYTITYKVTDKAGNSTTKTRTINVAEMRTTIEINGQQFVMEYNPQLREANAISFPFNLAVVTVFEKAYVDWLIEHNNQRFAAYWSVVVTLDADKKIVEYRDANTNQMDATGSKIGTEWCSGTPTGVNNAYEHRQGMLANLNVPEGGYVIVFINDGANGPGTPRAFGYEQVVDKAFDAIGLEVKFNNVPDGAAFDAAKTYPVIKLEEEVLDNRYIPVVKLDQGTAPTEAFGADLLGGVSVYHDRETLTAVVHEIYKKVGTEETIIDVDDVDADDLEATYGIRYKVTDAVGNVATETRIFQYVKSAALSEYVVVISGREFPIKFDFNFDDQIGFEPTAWRLSKAHLESLEGFSTDENGGANLSPRKWYNIGWCVLAVTDADGKVIEIRMHNDGRTLTWDAENSKIIETLNVFPPAKLQMGLLDRVPDGGFVYVFQHTNFDDSPRTFAYQTLINSASDTGGGFSRVEWMDIQPFADDFRIVVRKPGEDPDQLYLTINGEASAALTKGYDFAENIGNNDGVYQFTKEQWQVISDVVDVEGYDGNSAYKMANLSLFVTDADGKVVAVRLYQGWTPDQSGIQLTVDGDGKIVAATSGAFNRNNVEVGVMALIPEGGFVYVLATPTPGTDDGFSDAMKFGYRYLLGLEPSLFNTAYKDGVNFTDWANPPINPFAEGFKVTVGKDFIIPEEPSEPETMYVVIGDEKYIVEVDTYAWDAGGGVGAITTHALAFSKAYLAALPGYATYENTEDDEGKNYTIQYSILAIIDADGNVIQVRIHPGHKISWDAEGNKYVVEKTLTATTMQYGILADIPDGGYVVLFQNSGAPGNAIRAWGCRQLTGFADVGGTGYANADTGGVENMTVNPFIDGFKVLLKKESELQSYVRISGEIYLVSLDSYEWDAGGGVGAITAYALAFSKDYLAAFPGYATYENTEDDEGKNYTIQYSILAITDADGKVVQVRIHPGHKISWDAEGNKYVVEKTLTATTMQYGILADIPDGGYVILFQNTGLPGNAIRAWGCKQLTGFADVGGTGYANAETGGVENMTVNPFAEGFIVEIFKK
ncbi:MAG: immunoglobulin-like domain-containing protein [Acholeplasmatales bacterium]